MCSGRHPHITDRSQVRGGDCRTGRNALYARCEPVGISRVHDSISRGCAAYGPDAHEFGRSRHAGIRRDRARGIRIRAIADRICARSLVVAGRPRAARTDCICEFSALAGRATCWRSTGSSHVGDRVHLSAAQGLATFVCFGPRCPPYEQRPPGLRRQGHSSHHRDNATA
jgi:hypothetical protein